MQTLKTLAYMFAVTILGMVSATSAERVADNTKWGKYIITELPPVSAADQAARDAEEDTLGARIEGMTKGILSLNDNIVKGSYYTSAAWIMKANPDHVWVKEHSHPFAEILGFFGSDPEHPDELNAVIEFSIDGEKHVLTKSALIFVPKNVKHCPLTIKAIGKPVLFITTGPSAGYDIDR